MRRILLAVSILMVLTLVSAFAFNRGGVRQVNIVVHVKDLPQEGLILITSGHPEFEARFAQYSQGKSWADAAARKTFTAFLHNDAKLSVVAYLIRWEFTGTNVKPRSYRRSVSAPNAFFEGVPTADGAGSNEGYARSGSTIALSLVRDDGSFSIPVPSTSEETQRLKNGTRPDPNDLVRRVNLEIAKYSDLTISLDGAFFEDGSFVGDDTSGFFAITKAKLDARRDLLTELSELQKTTGSESSSYTHLESIVQQDVSKLGLASTPDDYYTYYKKFYAQDILGSRSKLGDRKALAYALRPTKKAWRTLIKKTQ